MAKETKNMVFPTKYTESVQKGTFEVFLEPSMTEPDNAMSIPEIIARFTRGYGIPVNQHDWVSGSASEEGEPCNDKEDFFEDFMPPKEAPKEAQKEAPQEPPKESEG